MEAAKGGSVEAATRQVETALFWDMRLDVKKTPTYRRGTSMIRNFAANALVWLFVVSSAAADTFSDVDTGVDTGRFVWLRGQVIQSIKSGENFLLRVNIMRVERGLWKDSIIVTYRTVSPLQPYIRENAVVQFQGRHRGKMSYKTVLGETLELPLVNACLLWDENDSLRFPPPPGCPAK
jgi:hypothetical protein